MIYRKKASKQYSPPRNVAKTWIRTAKSLSEGKGIPPRTPYAKNVYGDPIVKPESVKGIRMDPATSMVMAGFYLFGERWHEVSKSSWLGFRGEATSLRL